MRAVLGTPPALRRLCLPLLMCLLGLAWAPPAFGHAAFLGSQPEPGTRLESSPAQVALSFTEPLNERLSRVSLVAVAGGRETAVRTEASAKRLLLRPRRGLATGTYRVRWHTVSTEDGHALEGSFSFGVRAAAASSEHAVQQSPFARGGWLRVVLRGLFYAAALLFVGALLLRQLLSRRDSWLAPDGMESVDGIAVGRRERELVGDFGWAAAGLAAAVALAEATDAASGLSLSGTRDFLTSNVAGAGRAATVLLLAGAALTAARRPRLAAGLGAAAFGAVAGSGHAASASPRSLSILTDWVHLLSAAVWLGGIALILAVWAPTLRGQPAAAKAALARWVLPAFGRAALPAFTVVSLTGLVSLLTQLGHVNALWETAYGRVLVVKIALVGLIAAASYLHALRLRPQVAAADDSQRAARLERRHWQLLRSEPGLAVCVIAAVAVLVAFPLPPRQLGEAEDAMAASAPCDPCPLSAPAVDELPVAENAGKNVVAGWLRRRGESVSGTVRVTDLRGQPNPTPVTIRGARQRSCGVGCLIFEQARGERVAVALRDRGRMHVASLPTRWESGETPRARRLLLQAQAAMRRLKSVRQSELVSSGPGSYARVRYRLQAPNRMAFTTGTGTSSVFIGERQWLRGSDARAWHPVEGAQGLPFSTRRWFRWTPYAQHVRWLGQRTEHGRRLAELALFDPGTPVWIRLTLDTASHRVLRERSITKAHFATQRYHAFNQPVTVRPPRLDHVR